MVHHTTFFFSTSTENLNRIYTKPIISKLTPADCFHRSKVAHYIFKKFIIYKIKLTYRKSPWLRGKV